MIGRYTKAGGLVLVLYVLLFEFSAGTRWAAFPRILLYVFPLAIVVVGLATVRSLLRRERGAWFGLGAVAFSGVWWVLSCGPGGSGVISQAVASDGTEMCLVQGYSGNRWRPYRTSLYCRRPGQNWGWFYYDHEDTRWWHGSIKLQEGGTQATIRRLLRPVAHYDLGTESLTLARWGRSIASAQQRMKPGWEPAEHCSWQPEILYLKPRVFYVTYSFEFSPDPNTTDRGKDLKVWLPLPREWDSQRGVKVLSMDPPAHGRYEDPDFGNPMLFWDFGREPVASSYRATVRYRLTSYRVQASVDPATIGSYDKTSEEYALYTRDEHTIAITDKVRELAKEAVGQEKNPYLQAKRIEDFVLGKVRMKILDCERGRGIECLLGYPAKDPNTGAEYYEGCCNQQSALFIALCRAVGIPARGVVGFCTDTSMLYGKHPKPPYEFETRLSPAGLAATQYFGYLRYHAWSEFYLPDIGWIPVDGANFGSLNYWWRLIMAKGRDIKIGPECPEKDSEGYGSQWVPLWNGRVDMMSHAVWNMAKIRTPRLTVTLSREP